MGVWCTLVSRERERGGDFLEKERKEKEKVRLNKRKATPLSHMRGVFIVLLNFVLLVSCRAGYSG